MMIFDFLYPLVVGDDDWQSPVTNFVQSGSGGTTA